MLIVISPAKTLDFETAPITGQYTQPKFLPESAQLVAQLQQLSPAKISSLMQISDKLGNLNAMRFKQWETPFSPSNAKQAVLAFKGDVYTGLDAASFSEQDFKFAQQHLRILSGLYGVLRPLDLMQAYRLEMGTQLVNQQGQDLYQFWGAKLTEQINRDLKRSKSKVLINLASNEYFKSLQADPIKAQIIVPVFQDFKNGQYKLISFYAKKARGLMSAYIIKHRLKTASAIQKFDVAGYKFYEATGGDAMHWVFRRKQH